MKKNIFIAAISLAVSHPVVASEELQTIVITGGRTDIGVDQQAISHIITSDDIEGSAAKDLPQILSSIPGISVDHNGGLGSNASVRIRGTESDHVLILINGVRTASATNGTSPIQFIPLEQIERIEVVKGPKSGLYGSEAIGGVIQIFTKRGKSEDSSYVSLSYGANATRSITSGFSTSEGQSHFGINTRYIESRGIDRKLNSTGFDQDDDNYQQQDVLLNYGRWFENGSQFEINYTINQGRTDFDSFGADDHTDLDQSIADFAIDIPLGLAELNIDVGYYNNEATTSSANPGVFETTRNSITTFLKIDVSGSSELVIGVDYYDDRVNSTQDFIVTERDNAAGFVEYALNTDSYSLQLALRRDNNEEYGKKNSGNILLGTHLSQSQSVTLSYGEAFKAPTFNDLYFPFTDFGFGFTFVGNPNLEPEESKTTELSYTLDLKRFNTGITFYKTKIKNLIASTGSTVENVDEADVKGAEWFFDTKLMGLDINGAIAKVEAENSATGERLAQRPKTTANLTVSNTINKLYLSASARGETSRRQRQGFTGGFGLLDLSAVYDISKKSTLKLQLRNAFDKEYILIDGFSTFRTERRAADLTYTYHF